MKPAFSSPPALGRDQFLLWFYTSQQLSPPCHLPVLSFWTPVIMHLSLLLKASRAHKQLQLTFRHLVRQNAFIKKRLFSLVLRIMHTLQQLMTSKQHLKSIIVFCLYTSIPPPLKARPNSKYVHRRSRNAATATKPDRSCTAGRAAARCLLGQRDPAARQRALHDGREPSPHGLPFRGRGEASREETETGRSAGTCKRAARQGQNKRLRLQLPSPDPKLLLLHAPRPGVTRPRDARLGDGGQRARGAAAGG